MSRRDNRGASFVLVIIAMSIVAILAVTVLWISLVNMQMKVTNKKNTDNFYSAEGVLDQICTGLQGEVSRAYKAGYSSVLENYASQDENTRQTTFKQKYVETLKNILSEDSASGEYTYAISKLKAYVDKSLIEDGSNPHADITTTSAKYGPDTGMLTVYNDKVVIKGIKVKYIDSQGYESIIETDIALDAPDMKFSASGAVPEIFAYSLIGNTGVIIANDHGNSVNLDGNLYAGSPKVLGLSDDTTSVAIPNHTTLSVKNTSYFIAEGDLNVGDSTANTSSNSNLTVSNQCQLWSDNIYVKGANALLQGNTYVADDLTIKGFKSNVTLGYNGNGRYVGFGDQNNVSDGIAGNSSAIIINGKKSSIDMSQLSELMVAGYAYINTASVNGTLDGNKNKNVGTGESVSVKGNQIAYLVPADCIGTDGSGADAKSLYNKNPLTYAEYKKITGASEDGKKYTEVNVNVTSSKIGKALSNYMSESDISSCIRKVFVPASGADSDSGFVYYYVNLPGEKASLYYEDYFNQDKDAEAKLLKYTRFYTESIKVSRDSASIYTAGKYSIYDDGDTDQKELKSLSGNKSGISSETAALKKTYTALTSKLITDYDQLNGGEASNILFDNLIDESRINSLLDKKGSSQFIFETTVRGKTYRALVTNAKAYTFEGTYKDDSTNNTNNISLIIATGDVNLDADFTGTVIAKGKINISKKSNNIANSTQEIFRSLLLEKADESEDAMHLYDIFKDGKIYLGDDASNEEELDYTKLITYENWSKK